MSSQRKQQRAHRAEVQRVRAEMSRYPESRVYLFDNITDPLLMEACIYEINALRAKYNCAVHDLKNLTQ